uniref:Ig-like domain-containing protein n=1 Tax=Laticauda laticaudata TaxID=8630 RepID=A0A8C5SL81_LATLA
YTPDVLSQAVLTQPLKMSVPHGGEARLLCTLSSGLENHNVGWYQDKMGQGIKHLGQSLCSSRGEGILDRFTGMRSGNNGYLTIINLQAEDEANYYCYMWNNGGNPLGQSDGEVKQKLFFASSTEQGTAQRLCYWSHFRQQRVELEFMKSFGNLRSSSRITRTFFARDCFVSLSPLHSIYKYHKENILPLSTYRERI